MRVFLVFEFILLSLYFSFNIRKKIVKKFIILFIIPFTTFSVYDFIITPKTDFTYLPLVVECFIFLLYILYYFYEKVQIITPIPIYLSRSFWIAVAFTIYCAGNFFLFLYSNNATKNAGFLYYYTLMYSTFTIIKNTLLSIGIVMNESIMETSEPNFLTNDSIFDDINIQ